MPKETVRCADYRFVPIPQGTDPEPGQNPYPPENRLGTFHVGWGKAPTGYVEIATCDEALARELFLPIEKAIACGGDVSEALDEAKRWFAHSAGFHMTIDRDGCNRAIKLLRKARDGAFGRDE